MTTEEFIKKQKAMSDEDVIRITKEKISKLAETGGKSFVMHIPPRIDDLDMIVCELAKRYELLIT